MHRAKNCAACADSVPAGGQETEEMGGTHRECGGS
jgi:hypothetical protein